MRKRGETPWQLRKKEDSIIDKDDFLETQEIIRKQIQSNSKLTGAQKRQCLQVLEGIGHSVIYGGVRQLALPNHAENGISRFWQNE